MKLLQTLVSCHYLKRSIDHHENNRYFRKSLYLKKFVSSNVHKRLCT